MKTILEFFPQSMTKSRITATGAFVEGKINEFITKKLTKQYVKKLFDDFFFFFF